MITYIFRQDPIPLCDLNAIAASLRSRDVIRGPVNPSMDWYDPMCYERERALTQLQFALLVDRNIYARMVALASSKSPPTTALHRAAAAVTCFASCCLILIEPIVAALEHELDSGATRFSDELASLRRVSNADPRALADFALGRTSSLETPPVEEIDADTGALDSLDESHRPKSWWLNFGCALKLACLALDESIDTDVERFLSYIDWCYRSYFFSAGATVYGSLALSPKRRRGMFKKLRSTEAERVLRGIRNATWDMTLISEWEEYQRHTAETGTYHLLCSFDAAVADAAQTVISQGVDADGCWDLLRTRFEYEWGLRSGRKVFDRYRHFSATVESDRSRPANQQLGHEYWRSFVNELEAELRERTA